VVGVVQTVFLKLRLLVWPDIDEAVELGLGLGTVIKVPALLNGDNAKLEMGVLLPLDGNDEMIKVEEAVVVIVTVTGGGGRPDAVTVSTFV